MTNFEDLPTPEQMRNVEVINYFVEDKTLCFVCVSKKNRNKGRIRFHGDDKLIVPGIDSITNLIIPIMEQVTGMQFVPVKTQGPMLVWRRKDCLIQAKEQS
jgi:hypothetical protein